MAQRDEASWPSVASCHARALRRKRASAWRQIQSSILVDCLRHSYGRLELCGSRASGLHDHPAPSFSRPKAGAKRARKSANTHTTCTTATSLRRLESTARVDCISCCVPPSEARSLSGAAGSLNSLLAAMYEVLLPCRLVRFSPITGAGGQLAAPRQRARTGTPAQALKRNAGVGAHVPNTGDPIRCRITRVCRPAGKGTMGTSLQNHGS